MPRLKRESKIEDGVLYLRCNGPFHDNEWVEATRFYFRKQYNSYRGSCRECESYKRAQQLGVPTQVKLEIIRKWLWEISNRCGGFRGAARVLGVHPITVERWLGRKRGYEQRKILYRNAKLILETLAHLRDGTLEPIKVNGTTRRTFKIGCKGCGRPLDEETPGCKICQARRLRKASRKRNST